MDADKLHVQLRDNIARSGSATDWVVPPHTSTVTGHRTSGSSSSMNPKATTVVRWRRGCFAARHGTALAGEGGGQGAHMAVGGSTW